MKTKKFVIKNITKVKDAGSKMQHEKTNANSCCFFDIETEPVNEGLTSKMSDCYSLIPLKTGKLSR